MPQDVSENQHRPPTFGATFMPGQQTDNFYMPAPVPDLVSPFPQRFTPEVPQNIQNSLNRMEEISTNRPGGRNGPGAFTSPVRKNAGYRASYLHEAEQVHLPNFSHFPKLRNRPPHVPPSDDEKEIILESSMERVNSSGDPEMQLEWAEDVLIYVDTMQSQEMRLSAIGRARPETPRIEHSLRENAINIVKFLADQRHPKATFMIGMWYEFGKFGCRLDKRMASRKYIEAAEGYPRAFYRLGLLFEHTDEPQKALENYNRGYDAHDSASAFRLGMMALLEKTDQSQNIVRGISYLREAAQSVDVNAPQAAYVLGMLQARELPQVTIPDALESHLPFDLDAARLNIEKSAFLGLAKAQLKMGTAYELGSLGCEFDPALSLHYNALSSGQGEPEAEMAISKWFLCGYEGVFEKNEELAFLYAERAAQEGFPTAEFALGYFYEIGIHVPVNLDKALDWYEKAAAKGNDDANSRLEQIRKTTNTLSEDHKQVAIDKIRSRHGSQRGVRPERFQNRQPPTRMPTVEDEQDYSENSPPSHTPYPTGGAGTMPMPTRQPSTAPYPTGHSPGNVPVPYGSPSIIPPRSSSTVSHGSVSAHGFVVPDARSSSTGAPPLNHSLGRPYPPSGQQQPAQQQRPYSDRPGPVPGYPASAGPGSGPGPGLGYPPGPNNGAANGPFHFQNAAQNGPTPGSYGTGPGYPSGKPAPTGPGKPPQKQAVGHAGTGPSGYPPSSAPEVRPPRDDSLPINMTPQEFKQQMGQAKPAAGAQPKPAGPAQPKPTGPAQQQKPGYPAPHGGGPGYPTQQGPAGGPGYPTRSPVTGPGYPTQQGPAGGPGYPSRQTSGAGPPGPGYPTQPAHPQGHPQARPPLQQLQQHQQPPQKQPHQQPSKQQQSHPQQHPQKPAPPQQQMGQAAPPRPQRPESQSQQAGGPQRPPKSTQNGMVRPAKPTAQTFEDMGIPQVKQSEDCVVM